MPIVLSALVLPYACNQEPWDHLPEVAGSGTVFDWPWCDVRVAPLIDCPEWGSVSDVGFSVSVDHVCRLAWAAVDGLRAGRAWAEALPNRGKRIEDVVATTWKPKEVAPPIATPHIGGPLEFWLSATRSLSDILADLGAQLEGVNLEEVVFPHYLSGTLDGRQRLEFLRFHIDRHLGQIGRVRTSAGFPA
jgi:hypothetical protein